jgi:hypothetical protein
MRTLQTVQGNPQVWFALGIVQVYIFPITQTCVLSLFCHYCVYYMAAVAAEA